MRVRVEAEASQVTFLEKPPLVGATTNCSLSAEETVMLEPSEGRTTLKYESYTAIDCITALEPEMVKSWLLTEMCTSVVSVTSLESAKASPGRSKAAKSPARVIVLIM